MLTGRPITVTITTNGLDYSVDLAPSTARHHDLAATSDDLG
jgi:hypothetical protein